MQDDRNAQTIEMLTAFMRIANGKAPVPTEMTVAGCTWRFTPVTDIGPGDLLLWDGDTRVVEVRRMGRLTTLVARDAAGRGHEWTCRNGDEVRVLVLVPDCPPP